MFKIISGGKRLNVPCINSEEGLSHDPGDGWVAKNGLQKERRKDGAAREVRENGEKKLGKLLRINSCPLILAMRSLLRAQDIPRYICMRLPSTLHIIKTRLLPHSYAVTQVIRTPSQTDINQLYPVGG